jgi:hypothetical protein
MARGTDLEKGLGFQSSLLQSTSALFSSAGVLGGHTYHGHSQSMATHRDRLA